MRPGLQGPIGIFPHPAAGILQNAARLYLSQSAEHPAAGRPRRAYAEYLPEAVHIRLRPYLRVGEKCLGLGAEYKVWTLQVIKERLYAQPVPAEKERVPISVPYSEGEDAV